jgi:lipopolysaccharide/colanic/teichoic acid biosynthesis glycosyltransferase
MVISEQQSEIFISSPTESRVPLKRTARAGQRSISRNLKRCMDILGSAVLIIIFSPILLLVGLLVAIDDGWPILHRRRCVSANGEFDALKFRTMRRDADAILNADPVLRAEFELNFKLKNDPRITRSGAILRKFSLDELPQLFNVLAGQMSLVGPRMFTAKELDKYGPYKDLVRSVRPGLTGYWQVNGRQTVSYDERVKMDVYYIENWSLFADVKILLLTPLKVFRREGAY